jgi:hypothetical protein
MKNYFKSEYDTIFCFAMANFKREQIFLSKIYVFHRRLTLKIKNNENVFFQSCKLFNVMNKDFILLLHIEENIRYLLHALRLYSYSTN